MTIERFKPFTAEKQVRSEEVRRLADQVEINDRIVATGGAALRRNAGGFQLTSDLITEIDVRITGAPTGSAYPWQEVFYDDRTTAYVDGDGSGTATATPAREINGDTGVAVGTRVRAWLSPGGDSYLFEYRSTMGAGGTTHNLLSATHLDTVVDSPVRGSIIRGNSTPAWARYALGTANDYLGSDGSDVVYRTPTGGGTVLGTGRQLSTVSPLSISGTFGGTFALDSDRTFGVGGLTSLGLANQVVGVSNSAASWEYKTLTAGSGISITHAANNVTISAVGAAAHNLLSATHTDTIASTPVAGGLIYATTTPAWAQLAIGTAGQVLTVSAGPTLLPTWTTPTAIDHNLLSATHTDTLAASVAVGDLVYGNATPKWARLPIGTAGQVLTVSSGPTFLPTWTTPSMGTAVAAKVYKSSGAGVQSIPDSTNTNVTFDDEEYDTDNFHDNAVSNTRLTVPSDGKYHVGCGVIWFNNATGGRRVRLLKNASALRGGEVRTSEGKGDYMNVSNESDCVAGDYFEVQVFQDSGSALDVRVDTAFWCHKIGN